MVKKKKRKFVPRVQYKFWLNTNLEAERRLVEFIAYLKSTRKFAKAVRDGIRLIWSLGEGDTSVLFELFPHIESQLKARYAPPAPDTDKLERQISELKLLILEKKDLPDTPLSAIAPAFKPSLTAAPGSTLGLGKPMALPTLDDDDDNDTIVLNKVASNNSKNAMAVLLKVAF